MGLKISLFGRFRICYAERVVKGPQFRRSQELLSYLLLNCNRPFPREVLATLFWEEAELPQARKYLRQALWHIQTILRNTVGIVAKDLLILESDWVQLNTIDGLSLDVAIFEQSYQRCQGTRGEDLTDSQLINLQHAVQLYCGDLLEGCYRDWCVFERERLQNCYLTALRKLVSYYDKQEQVDYGVAHAERILRHDPADEQAHYYLMHLHWIAGRRTKAIRQYQCCKKVLAEELGIQPAERTKMLYERIRSNQENPSATSAHSRFSPR